MGPFRTLMKSPLRILLYVFLLAAAVRLLHFLATGVIPAGDTIVWDPVAQEWARGGLTAIGPELGNLFLRFFDFRVIYPLFLTAIYLLFGVGNHAAVVLVQIALDSSVAAALAWFFLREGRTGSGLIAAALYIALWETFRWTAYILTDTLFVFDLVLLFGLAISIRSHWTPWKSAALGLISVWTQLTRGNAVLLLLLLPFFLALGLRQKIHRAIAHLLIAFAVAGVFFVPFLFKWSTLPGRVQFQESQAMKRRSFNEVLLFGTQVIQDGKIKSNLKHGETNFLAYLRKYPLDFAKITFLKLVALYNPVANNFSWKHNLLNLLYLVPLYGFAVAGALREREVPLVPMLVLFVLCLTLLQMLTWVDYDQRYRASITPFLVMLAAVGSAGMLERRGYLPDGFKST